MKTIHFLTGLVAFSMVLLSCKSPDKNNPTMKSHSSNPEITIMTLDPGHFHAALVQKIMYPGVSEQVFVYAPEGNDVDLHLQRIQAFNTREENPTKWETKVYRGDDFFEKMLNEKPGNLMVVSGNNAKKTEYILEAISEGIHVLADKPMVILPEQFSLLEKAFATAKEKDVLLYDIMTERFEITTLLQKELSQIPEVFGTLINGSPENPSITKESVHHIFKYVSGKALIRPPWFMDAAQQGNGIVDVATHLVDLVQWECFPGEILDYKNDIHILGAKTWPTRMDISMFEKVTGLKEFPVYLEKDIIEDSLHANLNGAFTYKLRNIHARVSVSWDFQAPEGTGDTHFSIMKGSKANLSIKQGAEENFKPVLYVETSGSEDISAALEQAVAHTLQKKYKGISLTALEPGRWKIHIPEEYKVGHEAHFGQVTEKFLSYLSNGSMPDWEVPNMLAKYYTTTQALLKASE